MRVTDTEYVLLTPEQKAKVALVEITDPEKARNEWKQRNHAFNYGSGPFEEYPGEAESRGVDQRGYNK